MTMLRSMTSQPTSFARLNCCEGEISWSMRMTSTASCSRMRRSSSRLPVPKYAPDSNPARFCVNLPTTSNPSVFASWRSSVSEASNSTSLTLDNCTAATMARGKLTHPEDELAAQVTRLAHSVGGCRLGERIFDDGGERNQPWHHQRRDPVEMRAVAVDLRPQRLGVGTRRGRSARARGDGREAPAGTKDREALQRDVSAHRVEDRVAAGNELREVLRAVVERLVRAEPAHIAVVRRARGRDDARAEEPREREREAPDAARATVDEDRLARFQLERVLDRDERREAGEPDRRALHVGQARGLPREDLLPDRDSLGVGAFARYFAHAEHRVAELEVLRPLAERGHHARKVPARDMRKRDALGILPSAHLPVRRIDARRVDVDDDFPGRRTRVRQVPVLEDLRAAEAPEEGGFHPRGEPRSSRSFTSARSTRLAEVGTPRPSPLRTTKPFR